MDQMTVFHNPIPKPLSDCEQKEIEKALECTGKKLPLKSWAPQS